MSDQAHMRHLPKLMREIVTVDAEVALLTSGPIVDFGHALVLRELRERRASLRADAERVYGHTPARGDRGPSSAGAVAA